MALPTLDGTSQYGSTANDLTHTLPVPSTGMGQGKFLFACIETGGGAATTVSAPNWTVIGNGDEAWNTAGAISMRFAWKYAEASESDWLFTFSDVQSFPCAAVLGVLGGVAASNPIDDSDAFENNDASAQTGVVIPSITTLGADRFIIRFCAHGNTSDTTWPAGSSEVAEVGTSGTVRAGSMATATQAAAGDTGTVNPTIATASQCGGFQVAVASVQVKNYVQLADDSAQSGPKRRLQSWLI